MEGTIEFAKGGFPGGQARALNIFANSEYPSGKPKRNETTGLREGDSIPTNAAKMAAGIPVSATSYATKKSAESIADMFDTGFSGVRYNPRGYSTW